MPNILTILNNGQEIPIPAIKGDDGITPHIGENKNWWIGDTDTGVSASGGGGSTGGGASETLVADFTVAEDVTQVDIPVADMATKFGNAREIILEGRFVLPTSDEATNFGKLSVKFLYSWGVDGLLVNELACLPTNSSAWAGETSLIGRVLVNKSEASSHIAIYSDGAARIKNSGFDLRYSQASNRGVWSQIIGFRVTGSHNIGAGSTIKIYARE